MNSGRVLPQVIAFLPPPALVFHFFYFTFLHPFVLLPFEEGLRRGVTPFCKTRESRELHAILRVRILCARLCACVRVRCVYLRTIEAEGCVSPAMFRSDARRRQERQCERRRCFRDN